MIRAVIDTNVLVSAMISSGGNDALVIIAIHQGLLVPYFSPEILEEYKDVLLRPRFGFSAEDVDALMGLLQQRASFSIPRQFPISHRTQATTSSSLVLWLHRLTTS